MKPKQLLILLIACGLVTGIALWKRSDRAGDAPDSADADNPPLFADFNPDEIGTFTVKGPKQETTIVRDGTNWVVASRDKFPASMRLVREMLNNTGAFHVSTYEDFDAESIAANKLLAPGTGKEEETGTLVSMGKPGGAEIFSFVTGSSITGKNAEAGMPPKAQWMKVTGAQKVAKVKDGFSDLKTDPKDWLDKDKFFKVEKLKSINVAGPTPEESWKLTREKEAGDLKLESPAAGEEFDNAKASAQGSAFSYPSFEDVLPEADKAKAALDKPTHTVTLETFDGLTYVVKVGAKVEPPKQDPPKDKESPPPAPPEAYYMSFTLSGALSETAPPYAVPAPVVPADPAPLAADANEEAKKKFEEEKKRVEEAKKNHDSLVKQWEDGKKQADEAFQKELKTKKEKQAAEQALASRVFIVQKFVFEPVFKKRSELMKDKPAVTTPPGTPGANGATPGGATPSVSVSPVPGAPPVPGTKIEAVTKPIEVNMTPKPDAGKTPAPAPAADPKKDDKKADPKKKDK